MTGLDPAHLLARRSAKAMWAAGGACQSMDLRLEIVAPGKASVAMTVRENMMGPHGTCSNGPIFQLAEVAMTVAFNTHGRQAITETCDIAFHCDASVGERLVAHASERHRDAENGIYDVTVRAQDGRVVAEFRGHTSTPRPSEAHC